MSLHDKALIVTLNIGMPPQSKTLKEESDKIVERNNADPSQAKVVMKLFARQDLRGLQKIATEARNWFKERTLPYGRAQGLIPTTKYFAFMQDLGVYRLRFNEMKKEMLDNIETLLANAQIASGSLFDRNNYPSLAELDDHIYFAIEVNPVPSSNDYDKLADLTPEELEILKNEAVTTAQSRMQTAIADLFQRLAKSLKHAATRLTDDDDGSPKIFRDSLVGNIMKAVDAAETLNIDNNDDVKKFSDAVKDLFDGISADDLRRDGKLRSETANKADELANKLSEMF